MTYVMMMMFFENHAVYEKMWKYIVEPDRPQMAIRHMRIACWTPKAKNTHSEYAIHIAFPLKQWLPERASVLRYTYIACLVVFLSRQTLRQYFENNSSHFPFTPLPIQYSQLSKRSDVIYSYWSIKVIVK
jgi:hypothetical protein